MKRLSLLLAVLLTGIATAMAATPYKNLSARQAERLIRQRGNEAGFVILDVRKPGEFAGGHIKGAINVDFWSKEFEESVAKLDRESTYLVYCTSGVRSAGAARKMAELGFVHLYNMKGGMMAWRAAGKGRDT